jgi:hypothetical protein
MAATTVHPVEATSEYDVHVLDFLWRIQLLDVVTGEPISNAPVEMVDPAEISDQAVLDRLGRHPFQVVNKKNLVFVADGINDITIPIKTLVKFKSATTSAGVPDNLELAPWEYVAEVFSAKPGGCIFEDDAGGIYYEIDSDQPRYVCVRTGEKAWAQRILATNADGILELPVPYRCLSGSLKIKFNFRDYMVIKAEDGFDPKNGHLNFSVHLNPGGNPSLCENQWMAKIKPESTAFLSAAGIDTQDKKFRDEICLDLGSRELAEHQVHEMLAEPDLTLWAVRRTVRSTSPAKTKPSAPFRNPPSGLVIHYNSGFYLSQKQGSQKRLCREALVAGQNDFIWHPEMPIYILTFGIGNAHSGYQYHIARDGQIIQVVEDKFVTGHAGNSTRELSWVSASQPGDVTPLNYSRIDPREKLDWFSIGIDVIGFSLGESARQGISVGSGTQEMFGYTPRQIWYLDRLIENLQARYSGINWQSIIGHDEARLAYIEENADLDVHGNKKVGDKSRTGEILSYYVKEKKENFKGDPGDALPGGMDELRGRHCNSL